MSKSPMQQHESALHQAIVDVAMSPSLMNQDTVANKISFEAKQNERAAQAIEDDFQISQWKQGVKAVSVTPAGQKLVNHYVGGFHYFTVAQ